MKLRKSKKGFTVVELVIVIAVIAVLAAILIPTFISLDSRAKKASDQSLVRNLNVALQAQEGEADDTHNDTMHDAVLDLEKWGYKLSALVTKSNEDLLWNSQTNRFVLSKEAPAADVNYWKIQKTYAGETNYSVYAADGFQLTEVPNLKVGFDAGYNTNITSVQYNGDQDVVIRTDSFTANVTVNTPASVTHYGKVGKLDIQKVAMASFHEKGSARTVNLKEGNLVIENTGSVTLVSVTATEPGKAQINNQGTLEVVAGNSANYTINGSAGQQINATISDDTLAIVDGVAKTELGNSDFDGTTVVLLKDYTPATAIELGSCTVIGNLTKLFANVSGTNTVTLKNIHSTNINLKNGTFSGTLTFDGGLLEKSSAGTTDRDAAFSALKGMGTYSFKNMTVAANITKGIKICSAKSVTIENCEFDASRLSAYISGNETDLRSLSLIDIQEQNKGSSNSDEKMTVKISGNYFAYAPQGTIIDGVADSDTAAAIKIKTEKAERSAGFAKVTITGNKFVNCYRDVAVGCNRYQNNTNTKEQADMDAIGNKVESPLWEVSGNSTTLTQDVVANRGILTYKANTASQSLAEKVGRIEGGCALWETYRSARSWLN